MNRLQENQNIINLSYRYEDVQRQQLGKQINHMNLLYDVIEHDRIEQEANKIKLKERDLQEMSQQAHTQHLALQAMGEEMQTNQLHSAQHLHSLSVVAGERQAHQKQLLITLSLKNSELSSLEINLNDLDNELLQVQAECERLLQDIFNAQEYSASTQQQCDLLTNELRQKTAHKQELERKLQSLRRRTKDQHEQVADANALKLKKGEQIEELNATLLNNLAEQSHHTHAQRHHHRMLVCRQFVKYLVKFDDSESSRVRAFRAINAHSNLVARRRLHLLALQGLLRKRMQAYFHLLSVPSNLGLRSIMMHTYSRLQESFEAQIAITRRSRHLGKCFAALKACSHVRQLQRMNFGSAFDRLKATLRQCTTNHLKAALGRLQFHSRKRTKLTQLLRRRTSIVVNVRLQRGFQAFSRQSQRHLYQSQSTLLMQEIDELKLKYKLFQHLKDHALHAASERKVLMLYTMTRWRTFIRINQAKRRSLKVLARHSRMKAQRARTSMFYGWRQWIQQLHNTKLTTLLQAGGEKISDLHEVVRITEGIMASKILKRLTMTILRTVQHTKQHYIKKWKQHINHQNVCAADLAYLLCQGLSTTKRQAFTVLKHHLKHSQNEQIESILVAHQDTLARTQDIMEDLNQQVIESSMLRDFLNLARVVMLAKKQARFLTKKYFRLYASRCKTIKTKQRSATRIQTYLDRILKKLYFDSLYDCIYL